MSLIQSTPIVHLGDVGTIFRVTITEKVWNTSLTCWEDVAVDVSNAAVKEILFRRPKGQSRIRPAAFTTDGTDGKIEYSIAEGDITEVGTLAEPWLFAGFIQRSSGSKHTTTAHPFRVEGSILRPMTTLTPLPAMLTLTPPALAVLIA